MSKYWLIAWCSVANVFVACSAGAILVPVCAGELIDKITILEKKSEVVTGLKKEHVIQELSKLLEVKDKALQPSPILNRHAENLGSINRKLWDIEDAIRLKENKKQFDEEFIALARSVYHTNDARSAVKREINTLCDSAIVEEKLYADYQPDIEHLPVLSGDGNSENYNDDNSQEKNSVVPTNSILCARYRCGQDALNKRDRTMAFTLFESVLADIDIIRRSQNQDREIAQLYAQTLASLGILHQLSREYEKAMGYYQKVLSLQWNPKLAQNCHAAALLSGNFTYAEQIMQRLYDENPDKANQVRLLMFHARNQDWERALRYMDMSKHWFGDTNIAGKHIVLRMNYDPGSSGYGDIFQFLQYAVMLKQAGARVTAISQESLKPLLSLCPYLDRVISDKEPLPDHDALYGLSIFALMYMHQLMHDLNAVGGNDNGDNSPYMFAREDLVHFWKEKLASDKNFKVGIFWSRGVLRDHFSQSIIPCPRSMDFSELVPLACIPNVTFYVLDRVIVPQAKIPAGLNLVQFGESLDAKQGRFMDTAAIMKNLDLVITIDSSIAHLAGALGVKTWVLLPASSCYRWLLDRDDSPYYPTIKLFRQQKYGQWKDVVSHICQELVVLSRNSMGRLSEKYAAMKKS